MKIKAPPLLLLDIASLAALSPDDLAAEMTELRRFATEVGLDVQFAVDVTSRSDMATLSQIRRVWPDVQVLEFDGP
jgi:hypothetical protein